MIPPDYRADIEHIHREVDRVAQLLRTEFDDDDDADERRANKFDTIEFGGFTYHRGGWPASTRWWIVGSFVAGVTLGIAIGAHPASSSVALAISLDQTESGNGD